MQLKYIERLISKLTDRYCSYISSRDYMIQKKQTQTKKYVELNGRINELNRTIEVLIATKNLETLALNSQRLERRQQERRQSS